MTKCFEVILNVNTSLNSTKKSKYLHDCTNFVDIRVNRSLFNPLLCALHMQSSSNRYYSQSAISSDLQ